ncbi:MAG: type 11 methyltransferase [Ramlibacter sp.]|nr:type 11 methyltransferase [Ramlibacter sp.]
MSGTNPEILRGHTLDPHAKYREIWANKKLLKLVYDDYYHRITEACVPGVTVEIGGGIGQFKKFLPEAISSDIQCSPMVDVVADAQRLPFRTAAVSNIVMLDVLHHVEFPALFFEEALRVLRPGGRCIMIEPGITWGSSAFYRFLHIEPVDMKADMFVVGSPDPLKEPYDSNQAIPTLLATRDRARFMQRYPQLEFVRVRWFSFLAYPLSGGFRRWSLMSHRIGKAVLKWERMFEKRFGRLFGFRIMIVLKRSDAPG